MKTYLAIGLYSAEHANLIGSTSPQVSFVAVARSRRHAAEVCAARGLTRHLTKSILMSMRVNDQFDLIVALRNYGFAPANKPGVYIISDLSDTDNVARLNEDGSHDIIAHTKRINYALVAVAGPDLAEV